jgi:hypothetical protein
VNIEDLIKRLADASAEELSAALGEINRQGRAVPPENTQENLDKLQALKTAKDTIKAELARRQELAAQSEAARAAFADEGDPTTGAVPDPATPASAPEGTPSTQPSGEPNPASAPPPVEGDGESDGDDADGNSTGDSQGDGVTASAKLGSIGKQRKDAAPKSSALAVTGRAVALGGIPKFNAGVELDRKGLAVALSEKWAQIRATGGSGREYVARVLHEYPAERQLLDSAAFGENAAKIEAVTSPEAITAAGGFCAPLENLYQINTLGVTSRPVRDALSRFQVSRGGIQYRPPMDALAMTNGLGVWTAEMDAAVGVVETPTDVPDPTKTCAVIECPDLENAVVEAIYLCLQFPNFTARFDPEWVEANTRAALVAHARFAENRLLSKLLTGSKRVTSAKRVSAIRDVLVTIDKIVAYYRNVHRLDTMVPLRWIGPRWVLDLFRADLCRSMGSAYDPAMLGVADAAILTWFRNRGVIPTFHLDGLDAVDLGAGGASPEDIPAQHYTSLADGDPVPGFPDKIDSVLYAEGDWLFLDGGTLDLGLVRDSQLNSINRYQTFVEDWEGVAFNGVESLRVVIEAQPTGMVAGTLDLSSVTD